MSRLFSERLAMKHIDIHTRIIVTDHGIELVQLAPPVNQPPPPTCSHSPDFATVVWHGETFTLTPKQRVIMALLWRSKQQGHDYLSSAYLLDEAGSDSTVGQIFRGSKAWGRLIVQGVLHGGPDGTYCLRPQD
jgi:hypothetical protein